MPGRRILSLWFPRLGAERLLREIRGLTPPAFAVVGDEANRQVLASLSAGAETEGLYRGQPLRDALAMCPGLVTRLRNPRAEAAFLTALRRWAGRFSPWVGEEPPEGLVIDLTGASHLFGGEEGVLAAMAEDCEGLGLTFEAGVADTVGAAWGLARHAGRDGITLRNGDAIDQEARATRSRSAKRHWIKGGPAPVPDAPSAPAARHRAARPSAPGAGALAHGRAEARRRGGQRPRPAGAAPCRRHHGHAPCRPVRGASGSASYGVSTRRSAR